MLALGLILLLLGLFLPALHILFWIGVVLLVVGAVLYLSVSRSGGRTFY